MEIVGCSTSGSGNASRHRQLRHSTPKLVISCNRLLPFQDQRLRHAVLRLEVSAMSWHSFLPTMSWHVSDWTYSLLIGSILPLRPAETAPRSGHEQGPGHDAAKSLGAGENGVLR